ncbi:MAG: endonuclease/exonuclease/phosphatase family protein [Vicinamibacteria bacterium]|nr:endonuclease/exonuclease/phosphatase family protein [Vicinamibacteria bacterium]
MQVRVITYNIHRAIGVDRRFRPDRIAGILSYHAPDVVLLQEVDQGVPRSRESDMARDIAAALAYPHWTAGYNVKLRQGRYGNATISRHPIVAERNIDLTIGARKSRGCQYTRIEFGTVSGFPRHLNVFNLHLGLSAWERVRQIGALARSIEFAHLTQDEAVIVAGDLNDWRSLLPPVFTDIMGFSCASDRFEDPRKRMRTFPSFAPTGSLDMVFYRGPIRAIRSRTSRLRIARLASDHLPVIVDFMVR